MSANMRSLRFYLGIGLLQGLLLMWLVLYSDWPGSTIAVVGAALLTGGGFVQLLAGRRRQWRTWRAALLLALATAVLVQACSDLPFTNGVICSVVVLLLLMTLFSATWLQGRDGFERRLLGEGAWMLVALGAAWLVQALFDFWTHEHHLDPFKSGFMSLRYFTGPPLAFSCILYLRDLCRLRDLQTQAP
ncbi:hypothetical protein SAMN03159355_04243 [Pseudomonas sp. NFPP10]|uniref:hypothetical protein n=1 Tax=unclassified Pseudomonas TaxID=196821 RepID=UPI00088E55F8|nr:MULTISPECIES: hypothetical protein [unclassified Pseudomonas]BCQ65565.1 hypothetical protein PBOI14_73150 [Pseudomonas sp. Boi14]SDA29132.1 hypothetical protein SAMN03159465_04489 [Pseudomonas sp. NFPP12]SEM14526.1 hypothetical protein SAMN03159355_04243 [Pseudomonas sp. NFPP10]SEQ73287.1 hypothetical protein SAMN03159354_02157 [Pseudomonas sp. NFPP19]SFJ88706.1 hypothetical protein SAMN03159416_04438 [Pseudomonas sp. NFPP08]